jgi:hypothetical protein
VPLGLRDHKESKDRTPELENAVFGKPKAARSTGILFAPVRIESSIRSPLRGKSAESNFRPQADFSVDCPLEFARRDG